MNKSIEKLEIQYRDNLKSLKELENRIQNEMILHYEQIEILIDELQEESGVHVQEMLRSKFPPVSRAKVAAIKTMVFEHNKINELLRSQYKLPKTKRN